MVKLKQWYIAFLEKDERNFIEAVFYYFLCVLSYVYEVAVFFRNFLYDKRIARSYSCRAKVISIGNLSWSGSGKTPLSIWLYEKLSSRFKTAILRRGYGCDEDKLLREKTENVFSSPDRYKIAKKLESSFNLFILDDGFQYRKLKRDINIVVMGAREFRKKHRLIPAYFFRESFCSIKRADIVVLSYKNEMKEPCRAKEAILKKAPQLKVYFSEYKITKFSNLNNNEFSAGYFKDKKIAAFCAIGYPQGFFNKLEECKLNVVRRVTYPDHHELSENQFNKIEESLLKGNINDLIITRKDKYHIPRGEHKLNIFIADIELKIDNEDNFFQEIERMIA